MVIMQKRRKDSQRSGALYEDTGYVIDTHTAVAAAVYDKYKEATGDKDTVTVIASHSQSL